MSRSRFHPALVLRSFDVGEADRFCILLVPALGRVAARVPGARRLMSRMAALLPGQVMLACIAEGTSGLRVTGTAPLEHAPRLAAGMPAFLHWQEGVEMLLAFLHDNEPSQVLFDDVVRFVAVCGEAASPIPAFTLRLLSVLGLLPMTKEDARFAGLSDAERETVRHCSNPETWVAAIHAQWTPALLQFREILLREHMSNPLRTTGSAI